MITATCANQNCEQNGVGFVMLGDPNPVKCGKCQQPTALSDPRPDPPMPEEAPQ